MREALHARRSEGDLEERADPFGEPCEQRLERVRGQVVEVGDAFLLPGAL
jgi:hypothetical protein